MKLILLLSFIQILLTVVYCKPSVNHDNTIVNISNVSNVIDLSETLIDDDEDDDDEDLYEIGTNDHNVNTIQQLQSMGIETNAIDLDILEDALLSVPKLIEKYGYDVETHTVTTDDGYVLEMHRMPGKQEWPLPKKKQPIFLMHGLLASSSCWVIMRPEKSLAYKLVDMGYDVWMGNARGTTYSRKHLIYNPDGKRRDRKKYWNFSWHEIGIRDLPRMIDYVLNETNFEKLHYIGHSQGTTAFWVMASELPAYNDKILSMQAMAPVAFMSNMKSPLIRAAALFLNSLDTLFGMLGMYEFLPTMEFLQIAGQALCRDEAIFQELCANVLFLLGGYNSEQLNRTMIPVIVGHMPAGSATKQIVHYGQGVRKGYFRKFDYGTIGYFFFESNWSKYGKLKPPKYNLKNIRAPVALHYGANDWLAEPSDVEKLHKELPNVIGKFLVSHPKFNHLDFIFAIDIETLLYNRVYNILRLVEQGDLPV